MTADRDQHGPTADQITQQLAQLGDDETHEHTDPPQPPVHTEQS